MCRSLDGGTSGRLSVPRLISVDDSTSIAEHVVDANAIDPLKELVRNNDNELLRDVLTSLDSLESRILAMRFGLDDGQPKSLAIVGAQIGFTRERIRLIQEEALDKMRVNIEIRDKQFLTNKDW